MALNISGWAIRRPIPPIVLFILLALAGLIGYLQLPITQNPNIDVPIVSVSVSQPGAAPPELETQVTKKIEDALSTLGQVKHITSTIRDGFSDTDVEFYIGTNTDRAVNDARNAISKIRVDLPQDINEPQIERVDAAGNDVVGFAISNPGLSESDLSWYIDNDVIHAFLAVPGVATAERLGGLTRQIRINLSPTRLIALGIAADEVNNQLRALNTNLPGGRGTIGASEQTIRTLGSAESIEALRATPIALPDHRWAKLSDLGTVEDSFAEQRRMARYDNQPVVGVFVDRSTGTSEVAIARGIQKKVAELEAQNPAMHFAKIFSIADDAEKSFQGSMQELIIGAALAVVVVFWFLRDFRATWITALAIPLSIIPTFWVMHALGFTLNGISLLALSLVIGVLIDDAIVEVENIVRHIRMGKKPFNAAIDAADEIGLAVIATTMTIVAVFLPVSFMSGIAGQYFIQFGITVSVAVLFSLLVARLITPMLCAYFLKPHPEQAPPAFIGRYLRLLTWCLRNRWKTVTGGAAIFVLSIVLLNFVPTDFIPHDDGTLMSLNVELPPGVALKDTDQAVQQISAIMKAQPEVTHVFSSIGRGEDVRKSHLFVTIKNRWDRNRSQKQIEKEMIPLLRQVPGIHVGFGWNQSGQDFSVLLVSDDAEALAKAAAELEHEMQTVPGLTNITSTASLAEPELTIRPRFDEAARFGVSVAEISQTAKLATIGDINANLAKFNLTDRQIPILVQLDPAARGDLSLIENLRVTGKNGLSVPLKSVAEIAVGSGQAEVKRTDRSRRVSVGGGLGGAPLGPIKAKVSALPIMQHLPASVHVKESGDSEIMGEVFTGFGISFLAGTLLVMAVLVLLFQNFLQPITIMAALPLSLFGALTGLLITNASLSLPSLIGILMLMGIVTKNSILLAEYAIVMMRDHGMACREALMEAGAKRARPIIMTSVAMIAGMLPVASGLGADADFRSPMAIAVIGGLISSTMLSLVFIPVVFSLMDAFGRKVAPRLKNLVPHLREVKPPIIAAGFGDD